MVLIVYEVLSNPELIVGVIVNGPPLHKMVSLPSVTWPCDCGGFINRNATRILIEKNLRID